MLLTAVLFLAADVPISTHEPMEPRGELEIYRSMTQNGTVARREVRDADGLLVEAAYYRLKPQTDPAKSVAKNFDLSNVTEEMLALSTVMHMRYDRRRLILTEAFEGCQLRHATHVEYDPATGTKTRELSIWFLKNRSTTIETSYEKRRPTEYVCTTGGDISHVKGPVPSEYDPTEGFGHSVDGLALRLSPSAERGQSDGLFLTLTVRNFGAASAETPLQPYMPVEILNEAGAVLPMLPGLRATFDHARAGVLYEGRRECRGSTLEPGSAAWITHYDVEETWGVLPPGTYTTVAKSCLPERGEDALTSNVATFVILAE